jgi:hypothetical protein
MILEARSLKLRIGKAMLLLKALGKAAPGLSLGF